MVEIKSLDRRELRKFGLTGGGIVAALFGLLLPLVLSRAFPTWPWIVACVLSGSGLLAPAVLGPVHRVWMGFGHVMGAINSRLILGLFFFVIVTPIGFVMRLFGWDPMRRQPAEGSSYRVTKPARSPQHMEKPF
jgi:hypothetical protein